MCDNIERQEIDGIHAEIDNISHVIQRMIESIYSENYSIIGIMHDLIIIRDTLLSI